MNMDERELKSLIRRIAEQVIRRMLEPEKVARGALVLVPAFVTDKAPLANFLREAYGDEVTCIGEGASSLGPEFKTLSVGSPQERQQLMASLKQYADIVLVTPPLWMLKNIAAGDDRKFYEQVVMRSLLWEKKTRIVLDFEKPRFRRSTFFEGIADALGAIEEMGAQVVSLPISVGRPEGQLELVTEAEIIDASREGRSRVRCTPGAIVTPLARDTAKELGISIDE